jgi:hypothetical protein
MSAWGSPSGAECRSSCAIIPFSEPSPPIHLPDSFIPARFFCPQSFLSVSVHPFVCAYIGPWRWQWMQPFFRRPLPVRSFVCAVAGVGVRVGVSAFVCQYLRYRSKHSSVFAITCAPSCRRRHHRRRFCPPRAEGTEKSSETCSVSLVCGVTYSMLASINSL